MWVLKEITTKFVMWLPWRIMRKGGQVICFALSLFLSPLLTDSNTNKIIIQFCAGTLAIRSGEAHTVDASIS